MSSVQARRVSSYVRVREVLRQEIQETSHDAVSRLPTERQLQARFNVSRHTIRRALQDLESEGLIRRTSGSGTYSTGLHRDEPYVRAVGSIEDLVEFAADTQFDILEPFHLVSAPEAAQPLHCDGNVAVLRGRRRRGNQPIGIWATYLPLGIWDALERHESHSDTSNDVLLIKVERAAGRPLMKVEQTITAEIADARLAQLLAIELDSPVLRIERTHYDASHRPVAYAVSQYSVATYQYRIDLYHAPVRPRA